MNEQTSRNLKHNSNVPIQCGISITEIVFENFSHGNETLYTSCPTSKPFHFYNRKGVKGWA